MAFDAGMLAAAAAEIRDSALGGRVEKIFQPERDEIIIQLRTLLGGRKILINAGSNNPRLCYSALQKENPAVPPTFCMLLRKHLTGAKLADIEQPGFERVAILRFEGRDEMGFESSKFLVAEVMGKYSNLIFADENMRVVAVLRPVDFTTSRLRQVLPGMKYELPPPQQKANPLEIKPEEFYSLYNSSSPEKRADRFISDVFLGISAAVAREIVHRACKRTDVALYECPPEALRESFFDVMNTIKTGRYEPTLILIDGNIAEYSFIDLTHYGNSAERRKFSSAGELLDVFFGERDRDARIKQRAGDIMKLIANAQARISRKLEHQKRELEECARGEEYRADGDLIMANIHLIKKGDRKVDLVDYNRMREDGSFETRAIELDTKLTPAQNAQRLYKKYAKAKHATVELAKQIELGEAELEYLRSVADALERAESSDDINEIREELYRSGYASKMKNAGPQKKAAPGFMKFVTDGGFTVLVGRNNTQNEHVTHTLAGKNDYWFHVKGQPGSHAVMLTDGREPDVLDFTQAARLAALYSSASGGNNVAVDYTKVKNLKKPAGAKPGYVIYHTNWTAYVTPDKQEAERLRSQKSR